MPGFDDLTPDQDRILRLPDEGRYLVYGPPGTGKTVVALLRAVAMSQRENVPQVVMFNRLLRSYCDQVLRKRNLQVEVRTYHAWFCRQYEKLYGGRPPETVDEGGRPRPYRYDWKKIVNACAASGNIAQDTTPLLVDEGQDLPRHFYEYISLHFPNVMVFADENQMLDEEENSTIQVICDQLGVPEENCCRLKDNMRNTLQIARVARHFYAGTAGGVPDLPNRVGANAYLIDYGDLGFFAERIVRHYRIHPQFLIAIITAKNDNLDALRNKIEPLCQEHKVAFTCYKSSDNGRINFDRPGIVLLNLQSMKGLEFDSVLVADLHGHSVRPNAMEHKMRLYVASSRPRERLYLFHDRNQPTPILNDMPGEDVLCRYSLSKEGASG